MFIVSELWVERRAAGVFLRQGLSQPNAFWSESLMDWNKLRIHRLDLEPLHLHNQLAARADSTLFFPSPIWRKSLVLGCKSKLVYIWMQCSATSWVTAASLEKNSIRNGQILGERNAVTWGGTGFWMTWGVCIDNLVGQKEMRETKHTRVFYRVHSVPLEGPWGGGFAVKIVIP